MTQPEGNQPAINYQQLNEIMTRNSFGPRYRLAAINAIQSWLNSQRSSLAGPPGPEGPPGRDGNAIGVPGPKGERGKSGERMGTGHGPPSEAILGVSVYLDVDTGDVYEWTD